MNKISVRELKEMLNDIADDSREVNIIVIDEIGTKIIGITDCGCDSNYGIYITGVTADKPYIYKR